MTRTDKQKSLDAIIGEISTEHCLSAEDTDFLLGMFGDPSKTRALCTSRLVRYLSGVAINTTAGAPTTPYGFDSAYYLDMYPELRHLKCHPIIHYARNGRKELRFGSKHKSCKQTKRIPTVTAAVPNYNHAVFLSQRLESIYNQNHKVDEIILLDDASTDESLKILSEFAHRNLDRCRLYTNQVNSGNVFSQWKKAWDNSSSEIIWICESDDFCEPDFLKNALPLFLDPAVNIVFGDIQMCNAEGGHVDFLDFYRSHACPSVQWDKEVSLFTHDWLRRGFAIKNILPNASGVLIRKTSISPKVWKEINSYRVCGDWVFYLECAGAGKIAYSPAAKSYFRQHTSNTSISFGKTHEFFQEHIRVWRYLESLRGPSNRQDCYRFKFHLIQNIGYLRNSDHDEKNTIQRCINSIETKAKTILTVGIIVQSLEVGGGEIFPIALANHLHSTSDSFRVVLIVASNFSNPSVEKRITPGVPIVFLSDYNRDEYSKLIEDCGIDIINTHSSHCEYIMLPHIKTKIAWVSSLHGGYDASDRIAQSHLTLMERYIDVFTYLSPKNLAFARDTSLENKHFCKVTNAVSSYPGLVDAQTLNRVTEERMKSDFVFGFAARGIPDKGWQFIVDAFIIAKQTWAASSNIKILMCGDSDYVRGLSDSLKNVHEVVFLGSVPDTVSIFSHCDCVLLPTVFKGESLPLVLLEALSANKPIIATDIGEIRDLICPHDTSRSIGWLIECKDRSRIASDLSEAMRIAFQQGPAYNSRIENAKKRSIEFSIQQVAEQYVEAYLRAYGMCRRFIDSQTFAESETANISTQEPARLRINDLRDILLNSIDREYLSEQEADYIETLIANDKIDEVPASCLDTYRLFKACYHRKLSIYDLCSAVENSKKTEAAGAIPLVDAVKMLRDLGYSTQQPLARRLLDSVLFSDTHSLAIIAIPKNASTTLAGLVSKLNKTNSFQVETAHTNKVSASQMQPTLESGKKYFSAGIIREPLSRIVSMFLNKYTLQLSDNDAHYRDKLCAYTGKSLDSITFKDFVRYIDSIDIFDNDPYLTPQITYLPAMRRLDCPILLTDAGELIHAVELQSQVCGQSLLLNSLLKSSDRYNKSVYCPIQLCKEGDLYDMPLSVYSQSMVKPSAKELCAPEALEILFNRYQGDFAYYQSLLRALRIASQEFNQESSLDCTSLDD